MTAPTADPLAVRLQYSPHQPEPPQHAFLWLNIEEALYGGAAGGGKSDALLMGALQYVDVPGYAALLLRKTYADLSLPGALIPRSHEWLADTGAQWNEVKARWKFPSGATITFGYLQTSKDRYRYQGSEFQYVGFDELTQFAEDEYRYLFSRLRKPSDPEDPLSRVPLRMRSASNPGGRGHVWVKRRLIDRMPDPEDPEDTLEKCRKRKFIPARLADNPHIEQESYIAGLGQLGVVERARLLDGNWNVDLGDRFYPPGGIDAAIQWGAEYEQLADRGELPPPVGGGIVLGLDWGDRTWRVVVYPLEGGGMWVTDAELMRGLEPGEATVKALAALGNAPAWPGVPRVKDPLELVQYVGYDAAGLQSQKTFNKLARRRRPRLKVVKVAFGNYKRETGLYVRALFERAEKGHDTRIIAISPQLTLFVEQLRNLRRDPADEELNLKPDTNARDDERDDGPDALLAAAARIAKANRGAKR